MEGAAGARAVQARYADGKGHVVAEFDITPDLWFFSCHFPASPD